MNAGKGKKERKELVELDERAQEDDVEEPVRYRKEMAKLGVVVVVSSNCSSSRRSGVEERVEGQCSVSNSSCTASLAEVTVRAGAFSTFL